MRSTQATSTQSLKRLKSSMTSLDAVRLPNLASTHPLRHKAIKKNDLILTGSVIAPRARLATRFGLKFMFHQIFLGNALTVARTAAFLWAFRFLGLRGPASGSLSLWLRCPVVPVLRKRSDAAKCFKVLPPQDFAFQITISSRPTGWPKCSRNGASSSSSRHSGR